MRRVRLVAAIVSLCPVFLTGSFPAYAQVNKSNLTGIVCDASDSAIPGVEIRIVNAATGAARQELSDATGLYRFTLLDFGGKNFVLKP